MLKKIPIILDTDPGIDDAVAIAAALFNEKIDLRLITTVAGNVDVDKTTANALKLMEFFEKTIPIARGASQPLIRKLGNASHVHGHSGLDGYDFPQPTIKPLAINAVEAIRETLLASDEKITLVPIGPLTNIAILLNLYPQCKNKIERIVLMGGSASRGNCTPNGEFNICIDPEAAQIVFNSGLPIVMCGLDVTNYATLTNEIINQLLTLNRTGNMLHAIFQHYRKAGMERGLQIHDFCAIAYLIKPELFTTQHCYVTVETKGEFTAGTTVVDLNNRLNKPANTQVCLDVDLEQFRQVFMQTLAKAI